MSAVRFLVVSRALVLAVAARHLGCDITPDRRLSALAHGARDDVLALLSAVDGDAHALPFAGACTIIFSNAAAPSRNRALTLLWAQLAPTMSM